MKIRSAGDVGPFREGVGPLAERLGIGPAEDGIEIAAERSPDETIEASGRRPYGPDPDRRRAYRRLPALSAGRSGA